MNFRGHVNFRGQAQNHSHYGDPVMAGVNGSSGSTPEIARIKIKVGFPVSCRSLTVSNRQ